MRLLQPCSLTVIVTQELLASFFQNADIRLVTGLLQGKSEKTAVSTLFTDTRVQHTSRVSHLERMTVFPREGNSYRALNGLIHLDKKQRQKFISYLFCILKEGQLGITGY